MDEVENVARALAKANRIEICDSAQYAYSSFREPALAAIAALDAARGKAEPVAWMYIRKPEEWPPANPVVGLNKWKYDDPARPYWIETPLYAHPPADRVARVVEWLRKDSDQTEIEAGHIVKNSSGNPRKNAAEWAMLVAMKRGLADAIERGEPFNG